LSEYSGFVTCCRDFLPASLPTSVLIRSYCDPCYSDGFYDSDEDDYDGPFDRRVMVDPYEMDRMMGRDPRMMRGMDPYERMIMEEERREWEREQDWRRRHGHHGHGPGHRGHRGHFGRTHGGGHGGWRDPRDREREWEYEMMRRGGGGGRGYPPHLMGRMGMGMRMPGHYR
jgi:hypothetical protein